MIEKFARVNQGHSIPFVREERVAHVIQSVAELKSRVCDLWHGTTYDAVPDILRCGLIPGGSRGNRNSVYIASLSPLDDEFKEVSRQGSDAFVQIDPVRLMELMPKGKVMQSANGSLLVNSPIPVAAFICIIAKRGGPHTMLWHRSVHGVIPASVGPAVKALQRGQWVNSQGRWGKTAHKPGGETISTSGLVM